MFAIRARIDRIKTRLNYRKDPTGKYISNLTQEYKNLFRHLRFKKIRMLELGIDYGGSLLFWSDFFLHPGTRIIGADIAPPFSRTFPRRVTITKCDQNDPESLKKIAAQYGPFDIILDDASHLKKETENTFNTLLPHVVEGGYYIIEDWSVGYWGKQYEGMNEIITNILLNAWQFNIESFRIIMNNSTLAVFKGSTAVFRKKESEVKKY